jgi:hypothetical protein
MLMRIVLCGEYGRMKEEVVIDYHIILLEILKKLKESSSNGCNPK